MDAAFGVEEWSPQVTDNPLLEKRSCIGTLVAPIDCGNGVCCPLGSSCVESSNGVTNCRGGVQGLGTAEVPGLTVSKRKSNCYVRNQVKSSRVSKWKTRVLTSSSSSSQLLLPKHQELRHPARQHRRLRQVCQHLLHLKQAL